MKEITYTIKDNQPYDEEGKHITFEYLVGKINEIIRELNAIQHGKR